jgi:hypothetical protein
MHMHRPRTPQSDYLLQLGRRLLAPYTRVPTARAAMITGSAAEGVSDFFSDLDMTVYYEGELPSEEELAAIRAGHGAPERVWLLGDRVEGNIAEAYELLGIQAQIGHTTIAAWERDIAEVLERFNPDTPLHKAMSGTLECVIVSGDDYLNRWKARIADYPEGLRRAMVEKHLQVFPLWYVQGSLARRDAMLWHYQIFTEAAYNLLGVLAGVNRLYFTTFQFKKMRRFLAGMGVTPERLAERLEALFTLAPADAVPVLEGLVGDVVALVEREMPDVDTSAVRKRLGQRRPAWAYADADHP